jgi:REP element-mobilizing transposase RayT
MPMFYHIYNRVAGEPGYFPFGPAEKEYFVRLLHKLNKLFTVRVVAYQVMSNHFHLVVHAPQQPPEPEEVCRRYAAYYGGKRQLDPSDPYCEVLAHRMRDISWYMHYLQQQFSTWFNRTRPSGRRGTLWADRFKHTLLGDSQAVWECIRYVEMNPVRAHMVSNPADYRFSSYGAWRATGHHPFEGNVQRVLLPRLAGRYPFASIQQLGESLRKTFAGVTGVQDDPDGKVSQFVVQVDRRVRYWVDGLVIGSELFVRNIISHSAPDLRPRKKGLVRAHGPGLALCCYKQLRAL